MTIDTHLEAIAAMIGVRIEYALLPPDRDGEYRYKHNVIRLRRGMSARLHRSVLAHELAHAVFGDVPSKFGPVHAKQERRAEEWAALRLIDRDEYRRAEALHEGHAGAIAQDLGVVRSIVETYRSLLLRIEVEPVDEPNLVYTKSKMGAGNWLHRDEVAS
ncbi:ImmA/IrrE family metallo-endopeptidase [Microbacterium kunmingense]|uniref:ImmA/IrrE family metallo-endopeptidase n=1 Tax=Microbacterium kunmingense TaxID=2915939 RepID=UPI002003AE55|nr:ImmA/IrrE family metallo-endopeptidase [Microbacterium kunmingense]